MSDQIKYRAHAEQFGRTWIDNVVIFNRLLSDGAFRTYSTLAYYAMGKDNAFPGQERLASERGLKRRAIQNHLDELESIGLITVERGTHNTYWLEEINGWAVKQLKDDKCYAESFLTKKFTPKKTTPKKVGKRNVNTQNNAHANTQNNAHANTQNNAHEESLEEKGKEEEEKNTPPQPKILELPKPAEYRVVFENNISPLVPFMADELDRLVKEYSDTWVIEAIYVAVFQGKRKLSYIRGVLKGWRADGYKPLADSAKPQPVKPTEPLWVADSDCPKCNGKGSYLETVIQDGLEAWKTTPCQCLRQLPPDQSRAAAD